MIPKITASTIYSTLGNNSSLIPLGIKDVANSCGLTAASYLAGDKLEGKDRFIDEFGTQAIWLGGLPTFNFILGKTLCMPKKFDSNIDVRILKNKEILQAAQELAPTETVKNSIKHVAQNAKAYKGIALTKFIGATVLTALSYFGLTKFRHKYTEDEIKKEYIEKQIAKQQANANIAFSSSFSQVHNSKTSKQPSFTGFQSFMFDPVKNLMIIDGVITGERLTHSRNGQDFMGYVIKEGSFWFFMYYAGKKIADMFEKHTEAKFNKSITLDARVIEAEEFKNAFSDGTLKTHLEEFKLADKSDLDIYKFAVNSKDNLIINMAKKSNIIELYKKTDKVDTRKFIDLDALRGIHSQIEKLLSQYENSGQTTNEFFTQLRKLKRGAVLKNIGACIGALGIIAPSIMLIMRKLSPNSEYQVKKDVEAKLAQE
ncbi:hypothetical protein IJ541_00990 [bacterium]|nr:hypothetical protein [bacterium]